MTNNNILYILAILAITLITGLSIINESTYTGTYSVDSIEDGIITLIREDNIHILLNAAEYPTLTEGTIIDIEYKIDTEATAELANRIVTLQNILLERSQ